MHSGHGNFGQKIPGEKWTMSAIRTQTPDQTFAWKQSVKQARKMGILIVTAKGMSEERFLDVAEEQNREGGKGRKGGRKAKKDGHKFQH